MLKTDQKVNSATPEDAQAILGTINPADPTMAHPPSLLTPSKLGAAVDQAAAEAVNAALPMSDLSMGMEGEDEEQEEGHYVD